MILSHSDCQENLALTTVIKLMEYSSPLFSWPAFNTDIFPVVFTAHIIIYCFLHHSETSLMVIC